MNRIGYTYGGMKIIEDINMVEDGKAYEIKRTWKERLFTTPWRPLKATQWITPKVPMQKARIIDGDTLLMHPQIAQAIREQLKETTG